MIHERSGVTLTLTREEAEGLYQSMEGDRRLIAGFAETLERSS